MIGRGQTFPVTVHTQLQKPYSIYLSDYKSPGDERMSVTLLLKDTHEPVHDVRLRVKIRGAGIEIESKPDFSVSPLTLQPGLPLTLYNTDFSSYLHPNNLIFRGITRQEFVKTGALPEGLYEISWQVYDYRRIEVSLSSPAIITAWIVLNNPPVINTPLSDEKLKPHDPQSIRFSWQPDGALLNNGFTNEYQLELYEMRDPQRNANEVVRSSQPIAILITAHTALTYGISEPALIPGMKYAFRIQAQDVKGNKVYKNSGYSEVRTFTYGDACLYPNNINIHEISTQWAQMQWEVSPPATQYIIRYREANDPKAAWFEDETYTTFKRINHLKPGTSYEYQLQCRCGTYNSTYTPTHTFTTSSSAENNIDIACKPPQLPPPELDASTILPFAQVGSIFKVGHFHMKVVEVHGSAGIFSGKGEIFVPFLATTFKASFNNLLVNAENQVISGSVTADFVDYSTLSISTINSINSFQPKSNKICIQHDEEGYDAEGYNRDGYNKEGYDRDGYDTEGYDDQGFNRKGFNREGYDKEGFDQEGYEKEGYNRDGVNKDGLDKQGNLVDSGRAAKSSGTVVGTAGANSLSTSISDHELEKIIKKYLKALKKQNKDSIEVHQKQFNTLNKELDEAIKKSELKRKNVVKEDESYVGRGMSKRFDIKDPPGSVSNDPAYHVNVMHKDLYDTDAKLLLSEAKHNLIEQYLKDPASLAEKVRTTILQLNEDEAAKLEDDKTALEQWLHQQIDTLLNQELTYEEDGNLGSSHILPDKNEIEGIASLSPAILPPFIVPNVKQAYLLHQIIQDENRKRGAYSIHEPMDLPVGIGKVIGNTEYLISIGAITFTPVASYMDVYMGTEIPWSGDWLSFEGQQVEIFPEGFGGEKNRLLLAHDTPIRLNNNSRLTVKGSEQRTFIDWDCQGFREINLQGEVEFCPGMLIPEKKNEETVKATFETSFQEWGEFIAQISIAPFQVKGLKDFTFEVTRAYADFSDLYNPTSIVFPKDYQSAYLTVGVPGLWQGFYLQEAKVKLPAKLDNSNGNRKELYVENLIIDDQGLSGIFSASGVIPDGSLNGWDYSVEKLSLHLVRNKLKAGSMEGAITLPIMDEKDTLGYAATITTDGNWLFNVHLRENLTVPLWQADMYLLPSSFIEIAEKDDQFIPRAVLNGHIDISSSIGKSSQVSLSGIQFQQLTLTTEQPYFSPGIWSLNEIGLQDKAVGFALTLTDIDIYTEPQARAGISFTGRLSLANEIAATADLRIMGHLEQQHEGKKQYWRYDKTEISEAGIDTGDGPVALKGHLNLFDGHAVYGEGFIGYVEARFVNSITVNAKAQFGWINDMPYWYVDAMTTIDKSIPVASTGLALYGFGGGAYYHMRRQQAEQVDLATANTSSSYDLEVDASPSGIRYVPDPNTSLGIKASVVFGTTENPRPFNGDVGFEVAFNKGGGVSQAGFTGNGYFMSDMVVGSPRKQSPLYAGVAIFYDFQNSVLHGNCKVYANVAGGMIRGRSAGNLAGEAVLHFDPQDWYIHIGKPSSRIGLVVTTPIQALPIKIDFGSYFMIGTQIEPMPHPPEKVMKTLDQDYEAARNTPDLVYGKGFAFGSNFSINTGKLQVAMFYGQLEAGAGFDVMLMNHSDKICVGSGEMPGMNGWYAQGQAYAYLEGAIGIRVTVFKVKIEEEILRIGAASLLQAALPNPFWLKGDVGGYYSLLGGKVRGKCNFGFELGQQCQLLPVSQPGEATPIDGISVIAELTPAKGKKNVDVFTAPQAVFNLPINEPFTLVDTLQDQQQSFRVRLDHFKLLENNREITGTYEWNERNDVVAFNPHDILPGQKELKLVAQVSFQEKKGNSWQDIRVNGQKATEKLEYIFTTGEAPGYIPEHNVLYSYPVHRQLHFLPKEHTGGYIQLDNGQKELFNVAKEWRQTARLTPIGTGKLQEFTFSYDEATKRVQLSMPQELRKEQIYLLELVNIPAQAAGEVDKNISEQIGGHKQHGQEVSIRTNQAEGSIQNLQEKVIYSLYFRTSRYNTFAEKLAALDKVNDWQWAIQTGVQEIGRTVSGAETFDKFEIEGTKYMAPLVNFNAGLGTSWHDQIDKLVYFNCAPYYDRLRIHWKGKNRPSYLGIPPVEAILIDQSNTQLQLNDEAINSGIAPSSSGKVAYVYQLPYYMYYDYYYLQQQAANLGINSLQVRYLLDHPFVPVHSGDYPIYIGYKLPGTQHVQSVESFFITKP